MYSSKTSDYPLWHVVVASTTTGLLIAVYILVMGRLNVEQSVKDPVKTQALLIANYLISLTEVHEGFGQVGLCDSTTDEELSFGSQSRRITSLNSAKSSLRSAAVVATAINSEVAKKQIAADLDRLDALQQRLLVRIFQAVESGPDSGKTSENATNQTLSARVLKALQRNEPTDMRAVSIGIQLGRYNDPEMLNTIAHPPSESGAQYVSNGYYKSNLPVPVCLDRFVRFYPFAKSVATVDPVNFVVAAPGAIPNAVLLEVQYEPRGKSTTAVQMVRRVCALLGGSVQPTVPSCFLFRFPQGLPKDFKSPAALFEKKLWTNSGTWKQATGGTIPGSGQFKLTIDPVLPVMTPGDALAISLYHWIRHLKPAPDPYALLKALNQNFPQSASRPFSADAASPVNSCLVSDTGAREHGFAKETAKEGQEGIEQCFEYPNRLDPYPQNAVPLYVDRSGNLNLAGRTGFDTDLVSRYLNAVYGTNLAALESTATAKLVARQSALENRELELKLSIKKQELAPIARRLPALKMQKLSIKDGASAKLFEEQISKTTKSINDLQTEISNLESRQALLRNVNELTRTTTLNADRTTAATYDLCSTTFTNLRNGLHAIDPPVEGFLLGRKTVFLPIAEPVKESDFFEAATWKTSDPALQQGRISPWFQKHLPVLVPVRDLLSGPLNARIDQKTIGEVVSEIEVNDNMAPQTVLIDSRGLQNPEQARLHTTSEYPFAGTPVSENQAFYYAKSATDTGGKSVAWSVVMRDLVFHENTTTRSIGTTRADTGWEKRLTPPLPSSAGLAVEFQIRRPLPRIEGMPQGAYITDPNKRLMTPQIPPVPAELM